jgi:hypothetical protein
MKEVNLFFPTNTHMAEFVLNEKISNAEAHSGEQMLTAVLEDEKLVAAETLYGAILKKMTLRN